MDGVLNRRAMYRFAVQYPKKNPLLVWQQGMWIRRSHFLGRDEEHAAVVLEAIHAAPRPPLEPKPHPTVATPASPRKGSNHSDPAQHAPQLLPPPRVCPPTEASPPSPIGLIAASGPPTCSPAPAAAPIRLVAAPTPPSRSRATAAILPTSPKAPGP